MARRPRSSKSRFRQYQAQRRQTHHRQRIGDRVDQEEERRRVRAPSRSAASLFARFLSLLQGHRLTIALSLATLSISVALGLLLPLSSKIAIDNILSSDPGPAGLPDVLGLRETAPKTLLWLLGGAMIALALTTTAFGIWGRWQCTRVTRRVQVALRKQVFDHASNLPLHRIHAIKAGGVASILREDAGGVGDLIFSLLYNPWRAITQLTGTMAILAWIDWRLLLGALIGLPLIWITHKTWIARIRPMYRDIRQTRQAIDAHSAEAFGGMRVVRGFNRRRSEAQRFTTSGHFMARQELATWWWARGIDVAWQLIIPAASAAVLIYGGTQVLDGALSLGMLMAFTAYLMMLLGPLEALVASATDVQNNLAALDRVLDLLDESPEFAAQTTFEPLDAARVRGRITLDNVSFRYPARNPPGDAALGDPVIEGVDLEVEPGETIAFVGPSGAGKTTLCNLIARFYDPTGGRVLLDGRDLRTIRVADYRNLLGIVEQDVFLFDGTVGENIAYGRKGADVERIVRAARAANAHGFVTELEAGYDTLVGERGVRLSGGQKQRLAIARAILADPRILILDEATSSLDTESERLIQRSLGSLMAGRTSFVIAHRLSTVRHADRIVVIERGRIIEQGRHEDLLAADGRYAEVLHMQLEGADEPMPGPDSPLLEHG